MLYQTNNCITCACIELLGVGLWLYYWYGTVDHTISGIPKLSADDSGIVIAPVVITDGTPPATEAHLNPTRLRVRTTNQAQVAIITAGTITWWG